MKVIDAHTGRLVQEGDTIRMPGGSDWYRIVKIKSGLFEASMLVESNVAQMNGRWLPLRVRWTHPEFFMRHVAFVPT